jgi:DNA-directed RNA polymerase specialized sigma24 family protein
MTAIHSFRDNILVEHKWDYRRGASLRTYFVGHCVIVFIDVYERWRVEEEGQPKDARRVRDYALDPSRVASARASTPMPGAALARDQSLFALLEKSGSVNTQRVMYLLGEGYSQRQTADVLDMTEKAVESHRYRGSERLREVASG